MKISLVGVLEDGTPKRAGVPNNPRNTVTIQQGANVTLEVKVQTPGGTFIDFNDPTTSLLWTIKKKPADQPPPIQKTASKSGTVATFALLPADTKNMTPGRYVYDVWLTYASARDAVIPLSTLVLEAAATSAP
jgi:hypothetical protein